MQGEKRTAARSGNKEYGSPWWQEFDDGDQFKGSDSHKNDENCVRPVRAF